jgi:sugar phosphate isomerase/epimerase
MVASIALELYSVREYTEKDFGGTVRKIAAMGYAGVETAGFPGTTAKAAGALFKELGLQVPSAHVSEFFSKDQTKKLEEMDIIGCKRLICPGIPAKNLPLSMDEQPTISSSTWSNLMFYSN